MTKNEHTVFEELKGTADEVISQVKKLVREGNARRLILKNRHGRILFQSPLTAGVAGTAFIVAIAPIISAVTLFLLFMNDVSVIVEREADEEDKSTDSDPDVIDITEE